MKKLYLLQVLSLCWASQFVSLTTIHAGGFLTKLVVGATSALFLAHTPSAEDDAYVRKIPSLDKNLRFTDVVDTNRTHNELGIIAKGNGLGPSYVASYNYSSLEWSTAFYFHDMVNGTARNITYHPNAITNATNGRYLSGGYVSREGVYHPAIALQEETTGNLIDFIVLSGLIGQVNDLKYATNGEEFFMVAATTQYNGKDYGIDMMRFNLNTTSSDPTYYLDWRDQVQANLTAQSLAIDGIQNGIFVGSYAFNATLRKLVVIRRSKDARRISVWSYCVDQEDPRNLLGLAVVAHKSVSGYTIAGATENGGLSKSDAFLASFNNDNSQDPFEWAILVKGNRKDRNLDDAFLDITEVEDHELFAVGSIQFPDRNNSQNMFFFRQSIDRDTSENRNNYKDKHYAYAYSKGEYVIGQAVTHSIDNENLYIVGSTLNTSEPKNLNPILAKWDLDCCRHRGVSVEVERVNLTAQDLKLNFTYNESLLLGVQHINLSTIRTVSLSVGENQFSVLWKRNHEDDEDFWTETDGGLSLLVILPTVGLAIIIWLGLSFYAGCRDSPIWCFDPESKWSEKCCAGRCVDGCKPFGDCLRNSRRDLDICFSRCKRQQ